MSSLEQELTQAREDLAVSESRVTTLEVRARQAGAGAGASSAEAAQMQEDVFQMHSQVGKYVHTGRGAGVGRQGRAGRGRGEPPR